MTKKKKLIRQIFPAFLVITVLSLLAVTSWSTRYFKTIFLENAEQELTIRAKLLQHQFADVLSEKEDRIGYIDTQCKKIGASTGTRVTVMLPSGVVIGDSFGDTGTMENHMKRPEIMMALKRQKGISIRYSATLNQSMMYIALPVMIDQRISAVVRTSVSISSIDGQLKAIQNNVFLALVLTILAAAVASLFVSQRITRPVEQMKNGALEFARGNLGARLAVPQSEELSELAMTMNRMAENLDEKITSLKSRTMELEAVHTSMQEGVIAIDNEERIITINAAAAKLFGFSVSNLKTRYILEIVRNMALEKFIQQALATHEPVEEDIKLSGNDQIIINIHSTALYDAENSRMGTLIIFHDITRLRRLETMHKDFAANVSHELQTPLTTVKGFIETLQGMMPSNAPGSYEHFLHIIEKNVNRMVALINDLLALSRLERLQGTGVEFEHQDLATLIQGAVHACDSQMKEKKINITVECPDNASAPVDPLLMEQAILNLLDNAVKYSPHESRVNVKVTPKEQQIQIIIKDNGNGIAKEHLSKIFNRFYRVDKARTRNEGGTGLGLAIVKHIVQYHHGNVSVTSEKGRGTAFTLTIPA
ncbi:two-component system, OmpR family, phosphate regulon sensor histidine kinase PhoR [Desulfocicer vacuolatum DSM 3385]|uniref:histidine kinase n=1 Tax=Desulfocicer vacuolatum DSM 3385 TaxID=1121400 RepID=A0A1W2DKS6_9BACT|nr:ATP-binding protein [Desulfocicer vacuolatum]SMC97628.1 two-component system, OmpR family, phosphate regulon sensor histidine kinase PhoR [Desulfocicer vacuolatum DSM 3385]